MGNPVVHWELMSKDPAKVSDFYARLFGWKVKHVPGGIVKPDREGPWPGNMLFYILVDGMGWFTLFTDPGGRMMGLWKAAQR